MFLFTTHCHISFILISAEMFKCFNLRIKKINVFFYKKYHLKKVVVFRIIDTNNILFVQSRTQVDFFGE